MPQSLSMNLVHLIYSTKHRDARVPHPFRRKGWGTECVHGDHVHALFVLSNNPLCKVVEEVKKGSSKWIKTQGAAFAALC